MKERTLLMKETGDASTRKVEGVIIPDIEELPEITLIVIITLCSAVFFFCLVCSMVSNSV